MLGDAMVCAVVAVKDLAKGREFYEQTLGLKKSKENPGGVAYSNGQLFIYQSDNGGTSKATVAAWSVDDVEAVVNDLKGKGVTFEHYPDLPGTTLQGDVHVMGPAKGAWFKDPDGNILNVVSGM